MFRWLKTLEQLRHINMKIEVQDCAGLYRNVDSNGIINSDRAQYEIVRRLKQKKKQEDSQLENLKRTVDELKKRIEELESKFSK
jgi:hypothetical protein